jgi:dynactin-4
MSVMARATPYTYIQCPCSDESAANGGNAPGSEEVDDDERTFDPRAPRSNYSLYPLEYLLYCEDCQQIRCPRCVTEEIVTYYCPNCLFEVPSSNLRSEGNRYGRSPKFWCLVCEANDASKVHSKLLSVSGMHRAATGWCNSTGV